MLKTPYQPFFTHNCTECIYLGSASIVDEDFDFYVHKHEDENMKATVIYRYGNAAPDYGSTLVDYVSTLSPPAMLALSLYIKYLKVDGAYDGFVIGEYFSAGQKVLVLGK